MTFCIISHIEHTLIDKDKYYSYAPYVREMNLWFKHVTKVIVIAPLENNTLNPIQEFYEQKDIEFIRISKFDLIKITSITRAILKIPIISFKIFCGMKKADHLHLRCPGNIGLIACFIQIFFPNKIKTAKYAGNWDPKSKQPISCKIQKWILSNTFITRNMQVLVYGEWKNQTKNIKPFFTATYKEEDKRKIENRNLKGLIKFVFIGTLDNGKKPMYAVMILEQLKSRNFNVFLEIYGEGIERNLLENYIKVNNLSDFIILKGNQNHEVIKKAYTESHFMILPSKSEGWPKAVAEAMFWGCLPISTNVSCVSNMLDNENRGILLEMNLENDIKKIINVLNDEPAYQEKVTNAINWSRNYTLDFFEQEIALLLQKK